MGAWQPRIEYWIRDDKSVYGSENNAQEDVLEDGPWTPWGPSKGKSTIIVQFLLPTK